MPWGLGDDRVLKLDYRGAPHSVAFIARGMLESQNHSCVRQLAEDICQGLRTKDYLSEILAVNNFVSAHTRYMRDPRTIELVKAPYVVCNQMKTGQIPNLDCDDMAALIGALCLAVGCEVRVVTVAFRHMFYKKERQYSHVFCEAREPKSGTWIVCDPVAGPDTKKMLRRVVAAKVWPVA